MLSCLEFFHIGKVFCLQGSRSKLQYLDKCCQKWPQCRGQSSCRLARHEKTQSWDEALTSQLRHHAPCSYWHHMTAEPWHVFKTPPTQLLHCTTNDPNEADWGLCWVRVKPAGRGVALDEGRHHRWSGFFFRRGDQTWLSRMLKFCSGGKVGRPGVSKG